MALLFMDSFDHYATADLLGKWTSQYSGSAGSPSISSGNGRRSTNSLRCPTPSGQSNPTAPVALVPGNHGPAPSGATCVIGFAFRATRFDLLQVGSDFDPTSNTSTADNCLLMIRQGSTNQVAFTFNTNGTISAYRGTTAATLLGTSSSGVSTNQYQYLQIKVVINNSTGSIEIRLDGTTILSLTGIDTQNTASATWDEIVIGRLASDTSGTMTWDFDDLYLLDGTTSADDPRNDFLGDCRCDVLLPDGTGNYNDSTSSSGGARYTTVDEASQDGDTTYNTFAAAGDKDSYTYAAAPVAGATIYGVQANLWHRKEDAGTATARALTRLGGSDYYGSSRAPGTGYLCARQPWAQKPSDSSDWTDTDVNGAEFGYEKET